MRTVIYVGLISIADAIREDWFKNAKNDTISFYSCILVLAIIFDILEFCKKIYGKNES